MNNTPPATKQTVKRVYGRFTNPNRYYALFSDYEALEKERDAWRHYHKLASDTADKELAELTALESEVQKLREALEAITRRAPIMGSRGDYRDGQLDALKACSEVARAALQPKAGV